MSEKKDITISVQVKTNSKQNIIIDNQVNMFEKNMITVRTTESPQKGKANKAIIRLIADYFMVPIANIIIKSGFTSSQKIIKIKEAKRR